MAASADAVRIGLDPVCTAAGVDLESVDIRAAGRRELVQVVVDRDGGIDLDLIAALSGQIAAALDEPPLADQFVGTYVLEVTSPGVDRPLREPKHWRRAINRVVEVRTGDGREVRGRITAVDEAGVCIDGAEPIAFADLGEGRVQVEFTRDEGE